MSDDALDALRRQIALEDISDVLEVTRGVARWRVIHTWALSDNPDERLKAFRILVGEFERLEQENIQLCASWTARGGVGCCAVGEFEFTNSQTLK
jgi:hypothetical protein